MAIPLGVFAKIGQLIWPTAKELLFGKYRVADYLRRRKVMMLFITLYVVNFGLFINMAENAIVLTQHYRATVTAHATELDKLKDKIGRQKHAIELYKLRLNTLCSEQTTYECNVKSNSGIADGQYVIRDGRVVGFVAIPDIQ